MSDDLKSRILHFAGQVGNPERAPEEIAKRRGWLDDAGAPTPDGIQMIDALDDQIGTRSVFR